MNVRTSIFPQVAQSPPDDILAYVYISSLRRYAYLSGFVVCESDNPLWGKTYDVHIYALNRVVTVKANHIVTNGAIVEIQHGIEFFAVQINKIDYRQMEVQDAEGNIGWVNVTATQSLLLHQDLMLTEMATLDHQKVSA